MRLFGFLDCNCGVIPELASNPNGPVKFEPKDNEYRLYNDPHDTSSGYHAMRYCFWCGRKLEKLAPSEYLVIPETEEARLVRLTSSFKTFVDVQSVLGPANHEATGIARSAFSERCPQETELVRILTYTGLSPIANVMVFERKDGSVGFTFIHKSRREST